MKLKNLFAITAIASALVLTGCKEEKKADASINCACCNINQSWCNGRS